MTGPLGTSQVYTIARLEIALMEDPARACKDSNPVWFTSEATSAERDVAKRTCETCPIQSRCLEVALMHTNSDDPGDYRGGTTPQQRKNIRRSRIEAERLQQRLAEAHAKTEVAA